MAESLSSKPHSVPKTAARHAILPPPAPSPTAITRPEMPAVRPPPAAVEAVPETTDSAEDDARITHVSNPAQLDTRKNRTVLLRLDGADAGWLFPLGTEPCTVGRHTSNALELKDAGVSRNHARLSSIGGGQHVVEDLGSRNGTFVRNQRVTRHILVDGDLIQFGSHACFRYTRTDAMHEQLLRQLYDSSTKDSLTGAFNRRHFDERLGAELAYAVRHRSELSLLILDIDHFKRVNDACGHLAGDAVLKHVARAIAQQVRSEDFFARYGGEEFALILRGIAHKDALRAAERIRAVVSVLTTSYEGRLIPATLSIGVASLTECPERIAAELIALADSRLYGAKRAGRNRVQGATPLRS